MSQQLTNAIAIYSQLDKTQRDGYAIAFARSLRMTVIDFLNAVKDAVAIERDHNSPTIRNPKDTKLIELARRIDQAFESLDIYGEVVRIAQGPRLVSVGFATEMEKFTKIIKEEKNIAHGLGYKSVRIFSPFLISKDDCRFYREGKSDKLIGLELPRDDAETILFSRIKMPTKEMALPLLLGLDTLGRSFVYDLAEIPHLLIAGSTGGGKSINLHSIICGLMKYANNFRMIMIDPKRLTLDKYKDKKNMLVGGAIIKDREHAEKVLQQLRQDMEWRYKVMESHGVENIAEFNAKADKKLPYIVVVIDELYDLVCMGKNSVTEQMICALAQKSRACGIHLIVATQRTSVDVITGLVKANFPGRISFRMPALADSKTILDVGGAQNLLGNGDMLFTPNGPANIVRLHGAFVNDFDREQAMACYNPKEMYSLPESIQDDDSGDFNPKSIRALMEEKHLGFTTARREFKKIKSNRLKHD